MRLFFTHLFRSIRRRPLQPVILIFTVVLAVAFCSSAISLRQAIMEEHDASMEAQYGSADLSLSLNSKTQSRFMQAEAANALLGEKGKAVGCFDLIFSTEGGERIFAIASDLYIVGEIFDFSFISYGSVDDNSLSSALFLTQALAEDLSVKVGDTVSLDLFGIEREYTVAGISAKPLVGGREALVDIRGVKKALSYHSALVSALGDDFLPSTSLYVDLSEGISVKEGISLFSADQDFADKTFTDLSPIKNSTLISTTLNLIISVSVVVITLVAAVVIFACFYILSVKRSEENATFIAAGARPAFLNLMQYLEAAIYWLVGAPIGILLSFPLCRLFDLIVGFRYVRSAFVLWGIAVALISSLFAALVTVFVFIRARAMHRKELHTEKLSLITFLVILPLAVATYVFGGKVRGVCGFAAIALIFVLLFLLSPILFKKCAVLFTNMLQKRKKSPPPSILHALKNSANIKVLHNSARLIAFLCAALISTVSLVLSAVAYSGLHEHMLKGDYAITNPCDRLYEKLSSDTSGQLVRVYQEMGGTEDNHTIFVLAADSVDVFNDLLHIDALPKGEGVILSSVIAKAQSVSVGDEVAVLYQGTSHSFPVVDIAYAGMSFVVIDGDYYDVNYNLLIANAEPSSEQALFEGLTEAAASEMSAVLRVDELLSSRLEILRVFLFCGYIIASALLIFSLIGLIDNLYESYRYRKYDFHLYSCGGASKRKIFRMKLFETAYAIGFGIVLGAIVFVPVFFLFAETAYSIGFGFLSVFQAYFLL